MVTYNSMLNACARCANSERAEIWFQQMPHGLGEDLGWPRLSKGVQPALFTFNSLINAFVKAEISVCRPVSLQAGERERAEEVLSTMREHHVKADAVTYSTLIHAWVGVGDVARAEQCLKTLGGSHITGHI